MRDPYEVLGVAKGASEAEVKKAFRTRLPKSIIPTPPRATTSPSSASRRSTPPTRIVGDKEKRAEV